MLCTIAASSKGRFWLIVAAGRNVHCRHCAVTQHTYSSFAESKISLFFCFSLSQSNLTNNLIYKKRSLTVYVNPLLLDLWDESISNQIELREIRIALFFCTHSHRIKSLLDASKLWNRKFDFHFMKRMPKNMSRASIYSYDYTLQIVCIFFVCEEANKTLNYLRLIANKANKLQRPIKTKIKASIKVPLALKRHFC